jgi:HK97 family phage major capsid protein
MAAIRKKEEDVVAYGETPFRAIDDEAYAAWNKKVPYLRASEAMQSTLAGSGDELVPTLFNSTAHYAFRVESRIYGMLDSFQMPSNPYDWPTITGGPTIRQVYEATDLSQSNLASGNRPASKPTTAKITFNALQEGIGALALVSSVLFEDAGLNVSEVLATQFARNMADAIDYVLLNGDEATSGNISWYDTNPTGTVQDKILILNGIRKLAYTSYKSDAGTLGIDDLTELQKLMGTRGIIGTDLENLFLAVDPGVYYKLKTLAEFRTRDKVGESMMTLKAGFVGMWDAVPVILTDMVPKTDSAGRIPSAGNGTLGGMYLVHRKLNKVGVMRALSMEAGNIPHTGLFGMSGTMRMDLQQMEVGAAAIGYNITI